MGRNALEQFELWAGYEAWLDEQENEMITEHEYQFLTQTWDGPKGAAYNQVFEFCRQFGWCTGFDAQGRPIITKKGAAAIRDFRNDDGYKRIDVI